MNFIYQTIIGASADEVAQALIDPTKTKLYYYGFSIEGDWQEGGKYAYKLNDAVCIDGVIKELLPGKKIVMTFNGKWIPEVAEHPETIVTYELLQEGQNTYLKLTHDGLQDGSYAAKALPKGWVNIISGLKTLLETRKPLSIDIEATMQNY